jgi:uncharacterized membrane protein YgdD (TMEM256/DUF423 family)
MKQMPFSVLIAHIIAFLFLVGFLVYTGSMLYYYPQSRIIVGFISLIIGVPVIVGWTLATIMSWYKSNNRK